LFKCQKLVELVLNHFEFVEHSFLEHELQACVSFINLPKHLEPRRFETTKAELVKVRAMANCTPTEGEEPHLGGEETSNVEGPAAKRLRKWLSDPESPTKIKKVTEKAASVVSTKCPSSTYNVDTDEIELDSSSNYSRTTIDAKPLPEDLCEENEPAVAGTKASLADSLMAGILKDDVESGTPLTKEALLKLETALKPTVSSQLQDNAEGTMEFDTKKDEKTWNNLKEAVETGKYEARSAVGNFLRAKMTPKQREDMKTMTGYDQKLFRKQFAESQFNSFTASKTHTKAWRRVDVQKGQYLNTDQLIHHQQAANSEKGMSGVRMLMEKAIALGPPWIREHPQTERTLFLTLEFEFAEEFEKSWKLLKNEHESVHLKINENQGDNNEGKAIVETDGKAKKLAVKKAALKNEKNGDDKKQMTKAKKEFEQQWKDTMKLKTYVMKVTSSAIELDEQINVSTEWKWAKNEQNQGELMKELLAVKCRYSDFHRRLMTEDPSILKKRFGADHLMSEMKTFVALKPVVETLAITVEKMRKRHVQ
jgi:hypothetical protein